MPRSVRSVLVFLLVVVVVVMVLWSLQRRLMYFPVGAPPGVEQVLPGGQEVTLATNDGLDLAAWWLPGGPTAVIVFPGNAGNRAHRAPLATALHDLGVSVLLVEYRGYGGNPGSPTEPGLVADARAATEWVGARDDITDVVYFGESLGGAVALAVAVDHPPAALVLRSPFTSLVDVARAHYGPVPQVLLRDRWRSDERIAAVTAPVLVVLGDADRIVPPAQSRRLADLAPGPVQVVEIPGAGHNDRALLDGPILMDALRTFLADLGDRQG